MIPLRSICGAILLGASLSALAWPGSANVRFEFKEPRRMAYRVEEKDSGSREQWLTAWEENGPTNSVQTSSRLAVQLDSPDDLKKVIAGRSLAVMEGLGKNGFILQAPDAWTALQEAHRLAHLPGVLASTPIMRRHLALQNAYAFKPTDTFFTNQWNLENRSTNGTQIGADFNVRAAWPITRGERALIAFADDGVEYTHPELSARASGAPHYNFITSTANGLPVNTADKHATAVAGLACAEGNNSLGISGVAPGATMASWKIFNGNTLAVDDTGLRNMFQYQSNVVSVQNHSWGNDSVQQIGPDFVVTDGINAAIQSGRNGRGIVMVRPSDNNRFQFGDANDDGYASNPDVITVGAARSDGRAGKYSNPGACILAGGLAQEVADSFFSRDPSFPVLYTTDRQGTNGYNAGSNSDYVFDGSFGLTSGATAQMSGIAALILSTNTNLNYRDVQQIFIHASRHIDLADPDIVTNGAGFRVSHNLGFGIPDAGLAVALARLWTNRPARTNIHYIATGTFTETNPALIPDDGLRVVVSNAPVFIQTISATPDIGPTVDTATPYYPLIEVTNQATNAITQNLTNKAALIQRGNGSFLTKITNAANAGAKLAIIYNNSGTTNRLIMTSTDFVPIPAVFISLNDGNNLHTYLQTNANANVLLKLLSTNCAFSVTNTLLCEHVGVRVQTSHQRRGEVRITLTSPAGTRSVLQHLNSDTNSSGPTDWTYYSTHHFYESSFGTWTVSISDENYPDLSTATGNAYYVELILYGVPITDTDRDGLDDNWEKANFTNSLTFGPKDDPDKDGFNNMREYIMGTDPNKSDSPFPFQLNFSRWDNRLARVSWPGSSNYTYEVHAGTNVASQPIATNVAGQFSQAEFFTTYTNAGPQFIQVRAVANP